MIVTTGNAPPKPLRPDEDSHPALDDDILGGDAADTPVERPAAEFREDEEKPEAPPPPDEARG